MTVRDNDHDNTNLNTNEPITMDHEAKLTAYALGELDEVESRDIEQRIAGDAAARATIEQVRATAASLSAHFDTGDAPTLTDAQRERVEAGHTSQTASKYPDAPQRSPVIFTFTRVGGGLAAAAAIGLTAVAGWWLFGPEFGRARSTDVAANMTESSASPMAGIAGRDRAMAAGDEMSRSGTLDKMAAPDASADSRRKQDLAKQPLAGSASTSTATPMTIAPRPPAGSNIGGGGDAGVLRSRLRAAGAPPNNPGSRRPPRATVVPAPEPGEPRLDGPGRQLSVDAQGFIVGQAEQQPPAESKRTPELQDEMRVLGEADEANREEYNHIVDNPFIRAVGKDALSTFSIDVDTASYSNMRRYLNSGVLPPPDAVRIEELINYFNYDYPTPTESDAHPFSVDVAAMPAPWKPEHTLVRIGLKGRDIHAGTKPATNLVFLLDVSGSMNQPNKLPLLKQSFKMLVDHLDGDDRVAIVVYAGASGLVLDSTYCTEKGRILAALDNLRAGGSTNGGAGIELAYKIASENFIEGGVNRVILATDGDFNVGVSSEAELVRLIEEKRTSGVYLSVLGFGSGNYQDAKMEELSNKGNGNAAYIDSEREARKALVEQMSGTLVTIAKDVKIQVEFNPAHVQAYRLIGYENRMLAAEDFNDDTKDAGEIGAGLTVTALYEIVPPGVEINLPSVDPLKYQTSENDAVADADADADAADAEASPELLTVKLRYKTPDTPEGGQSIYLDKPFIDSGMSIAQAPADLKFASAVAGTGMILRRSPYRGKATLDVLLDLAEQGAGDDTGGYRAEFIQMMRQASELLPAELTIAESDEDAKQQGGSADDQPAATADDEVDSIPSRRD